MKGGWAVVIGAVAVLLLAPSGAHAAPGSYRLKGKKCRAGYVRQVRHVKRHRQIWCIRPKSTRHKPATQPTPPPTLTPTPAPPPTPTATPTFTIVTTLEGGGFGTGQPAYKTVSASVNTFASGPGSGVAGVPVTITLADHVTGQALATFAVNSFGGSCAIVKEITGSNWVLKGEAVASYPGCPIGTITSPANGDYIEIMGSFAGNAQYAASTSKWELFV
jgi:hypothetical protein